MNGRTRILGLFVASALAAACSAVTSDDVESSGSQVSTTQHAFDKNAVIEDKELLDAEALTADQVQAFLTKTPWGTKSVLADYEEDGKSASQILTDAATKNGINPLVLLVRLQMEQSLIRKETAPQSTIREAFGCGCPHSPVCSDAYRGFANQAECAAGTLRRSVDRAKSPQGTASGWKVGASKKTEDGVSVTPKNAGTAALYTYTPWVGGAGGGRQGVGGASLHHEIWVRFADEVSYGSGGADQVQGSSSSSGSSGADQGTSSGSSGADQGTSSGSSGADQGSSGSSGADDPMQDPSQMDQGSSGTSTSSSSSSGSTSSSGGSSGTSSTSSSGGSSGTSGTSTSSSGGSSGSSGTTTPPHDAPQDDDALLHDGNNTPSSNDAPPPRSGSRSRSSSSSGGSSGTGEEQTDLPSTKKQGSSGCSTTGSTGTGALGNGLVVLGAVVSSIVGSRRRRAR